MSRRKKLSKGGSRRLFKKTSGTHKKNLIHRPVMRGGYRL